MLRVVPGNLSEIRLKFALKFCRKVQLASVQRRLKAALWRLDISQIYPEGITLTPHCE